MLIIAKKITFKLASKPPVTYKLTQRKRLQHCQHVIFHHTNSAVVELIWSLINGANESPAWMNGHTSEPQVYHQNPVDWSCAWPNLHSAGGKTKIDWNQIGALLKRDAHMWLFVKEFCDYIQGVWTDSLHTPALVKIKANSALHYGSHCTTLHTFIVHTLHFFAISIQHHPH